MSIIDPNNHLLNISRHYMTSIPYLSNYVNITKLNMSVNLLCKIDPSNLPPNLTTLILSKNNIDIVIDKTIIPLNIKKLKLNDNKIPKFDGTGLINLKKLYISGNQLTEFIFPPNIENLDISNNALSVLDNFPQTLKIIDCGNNHLEYLPKINNDLIMMVCNLNRIDTLSNLPDTIKLLDASDNLIRSIKSIPNSMQDLKLSNNLLTEITCRLPPTLNELYLDNNTLSKIPKLPNSVKTICLQQNELEEIDIEDIPMYAEYIDVSNNRIKEIPEYLKKNIKTFKYAGNFENCDIDYKKLTIDDDDVSYYDDSLWNDDDDDNYAYLYKNANTNKNKNKNKKEEKKNQGTIYEYFKDDDANDPDNPYTSYDPNASYDPYPNYQNYNYNHNYNHIYGNSNKFSPYRDDSSSYKNLDYYKKLHNTTTNTEYTNINLGNPCCLSVYNKKQIIL